MADEPGASPPPVTETPHDHSAEPFDGYHGADAQTVVRKIHSADEGPQRELLKRRVRLAEAQRPEPRKTIMDATEPQDRPSLDDVATGRAANRNVRVVSTLEEV